MSTLIESHRGSYRFHLRFHCLLLLAIAASAARIGATEATISPGTHKIQVNDPAVAAQLLAQRAEWIAGYQGYALLRVKDGNAMLAKAAANAEMEVRDDYNLILLNALQLDTSSSGIQAMRNPISAFTGNRMHLVQFAGPVQPAWREELLQTGVRIVGYIPRNAYLVYGDAKALAAVQELATKAIHIQWEGAYLPEYRINPAALAVAAQLTAEANPNVKFAIQLFEDPQSNADTLKLIDQLKLEPISKQNQVLGYVNVIVSLPGSALATIAAQPDVVSIQPWSVPKKLCERQAQILAGKLSGSVPSGPGYLNWLAQRGFTQAQFDASGFAVDVSDSGLDNGTTTPNHPGLYVRGITNNTSRVIYARLVGRPNAGSTIKGCDGHGTINAHIIGGYDDMSGFPHTDNAGYHYGLGVCPFVRLGSSVVFDPEFFTSPDFTRLQSQAYADGARVSANSWGDPILFDGGLYNVESQEYDALVRDAQPANALYATNGNQEMVIVFAAGNNGPNAGSVEAPGTGKNVLTVGAAENVQPFGSEDGTGIDDSGADSANDIIFFSSRGPCRDRRHKPDIVSPGTHVSGGVAQAPDPGPLGMADPCFYAGGVSGGPWMSPEWPFWPEGQELYTACSGTSQATPGAAGAAALVRQWFINKYSVPPSAAMTKAYLMNTARYLDGVGANDSLWSDRQGMGEINLGMAFDDTSRLVYDQVGSYLFTASGQVLTFSGAVKDPLKPLRVTLGWSDAPGTTAGAAYANNLDLIVNIGGKSYKGNVFAGAFSTTGGNADGQNNVESVFLPAGASGPFTITILATDINSDGVPNNGNSTDQDFALVVYNAIPPPPVINSFGPTDLYILNGQRATFTVTATSRETINYQWRKNGTTITGATNTAYTIASANVLDSGVYSVVASDINGASTSPDGRLTVVPTVPLNFALNTTNFIWTTETNTPWFGQTNTSHDAEASAQSYFIASGEQTSLRAAVTGPGTLSFWWKIVSPANGGRCVFSDYKNGYTNIAQINGPAEWTNITILLPTGLQTVEWKYTNLSSPINGANGAYLDQVTYVAGPTLPYILTQPVSQGVRGGTPVMLSVQANGTPVLSYQWYINGAVIPGATNSAYVIASAGAVDAGHYTVQISNAFGSVLSQEAVLQVVPVVVLGANDYGQTVVSMAATNAIGIGAGSWHTLIVGSNGRVTGLGDNVAGQCTPPPDLTNAMAVAGGGAHSLALQSDGTVTAWGDNSYGQSRPPAGLSNVSAVAAGSWHSVALRSDGTVVVWGDNSFGQLNVPAGLNSVVAIAASGDHTLALKADGTVVAWGANTDPDYSFSGQSIVPWGLVNAADIAAGDYHSLATDNRGSVTGWGYNTLGETQAPANATNIVALAGGNQFSVAIKADGTAVAWGNDWNGQADLPAGLSNVIAVAAGDAHTVILLGRRSDPPRMAQAVRQGGQFHVWVPTVAGHSYALESSASLTSGTWTTVQWLRGNGSLELFVDPSANAPRRFYRVRQW